MNDYYDVFILTDAYTWENIIPISIKDISTISPARLRKESVGRIELKELKSLLRHPSFTDRYNELTSTDDNGNVEKLYDALGVAININKKIKEFLIYLDYLIENSEIERVLALEQLRYSIYNNINLICTGTEASNEDLLAANAFYSMEELFYNLNTDEDMVTFDIKGELPIYFEMLKNKLSSKFNGRNLYIFTSNFTDDLFDSEEEKKFRLKIIELEGKKIHIKVIDKIEVLLIG